MTLLQKMEKNFSFFPKFIHFAPKNMKDQSFHDIDIETYSDFPSINNIEEKRKVSWTSARGRKFEND